MVVSWELTPAAGRLRADYGQLDLLGLPAIAYANLFH
jgi:hypothetical protein